ncbi:MAG: 30S ribosomal protein S20 [Deltaproteobacteria bacterium]|nr:MAG: 30S ribosomal protein S20 [Deltaproteobacteria bacterium RIFCSPLOWO2_02_44_9]
MATHKSAIKRHRQNLKRRVRNITIKSAIKTAIKQVKDNIASGNAEKAKASLANTVKVLDKAVSKGALHRNNASRKVSRLIVAVNSISAK